eukprot:4230852-Pyramimonas_sp.AAC.1
MKRARAPSQRSTVNGQWRGAVWSSEDAQRVSTPTTDRKSRCKNLPLTSDDQRRRPKAPTPNY